MPPGTPFEGMQPLEGPPGLPFAPLEQANHRVQIIQQQSPNLLAYQQMWQPMQGPMGSQFMQFPGGAFSMGPMQQMQNPQLYWQVPQQYNPVYGAAMNVTPQPPNFMNMAAANILAGNINYPRPVYMNYQLMVYRQMHQQMLMQQMLQQQMLKQQMMQQHMQQQFMQPMMQSGYPGMNFQGLGTSFQMPGFGQQNIFPGMMPGFPQQNMLPGQMPNPNTGLPQNPNQQLPAYPGLVPPLYPSVPLPHPNPGPNAGPPAGANVMRQQAMAEIGRIAVNGAAVEVQGMEGNFFSRYGIPQAYILQHVQALQEAGQRLTQALVSRGGQWRGVTDGLRVWAVSADRNEVALATKTTILIAPGTTDLRTLQQRGGAMQTIDGRAARFRPNDGAQDIVEITGGDQFDERRDGRVALRRNGSVGLYQDGRLRFVVASGPVSLPRTIGASGDIQIAAAGHYTITEEGTALGRYQDESGRLQAQYPGMNPEQRAGQYMQTIAQSLRTPEAIGTWIHNCVTWTPTPGYVHPLETFMTGRGDCKNWARLAQAILTRAGVHAVVMRQADNHYVAAFVERSASGYQLSTIDTNGFTRHTAAVWSSPAHAFQSVWGQGIQYELRRNQLSPQGQQLARNIIAQGGGASIIREPQGLQQENQSTLMQLEPFFVQGRPNPYWNQFVRG